MTNIEFILASAVIFLAITVVVYIVELRSVRREHKSFEDALMGRDEDQDG